MYEEEQTSHRAMHASSARHDNSRQPAQAGFWVKMLLVCCWRRYLIREMLIPRQDLYVSVQQNISMTRRGDELVPPSIDLDSRTALSWRILAPTTRRKRNNGYLYSTGWRCLAAGQISPRSLQLNIIAKCSAYPLDLPRI